MKQISLLLALLITGFSVYAQELKEAPESDFQVALNRTGDGVVIVKYTGKATQVRIPSQIQGFPVVEIGEDAFTRYSFYGGNSPMTAITRIEFPEGLLAIGPGAFHKQNITQLFIPETVVAIGAYAFMDCERLTSVILPSSLVNIGGSTSGFSLGGGVFQGCVNIKSVVIPEGIPYIGIAMFENCYQLKEVVIPSTVTEIRESAFSINSYDDKLMGITKITFTGNNLKRIGRWAFSGTGFVSLEIPEGVTHINEGAFRSLDYLTTLTLPSTIVELGANSFGHCVKLTTVTIPESVTKINFPVDYVMRTNAFNGCTGLNLATQAALRKVGWGGL